VYPSALHHFIDEFLYERTVDDFTTWLERISLQVAFVDTISCDREVKRAMKTVHSPVSDTREDSLCFVSHDCLLLASPKTTSALPEPGEPFLKGQICSDHVIGKKHNIKHCSKETIESTIRILAKEINGKHDDEQDSAP